MITALLVLLIVTNYLWFVAFKSYRDEILKGLEELGRGNTTNNSINGTTKRIKQRNYSKLNRRKYETSS